MFKQWKEMIRKKWSREMEENDILQEEIPKLISEGAILIDVRSPQEYQEGHMENAKLLPEYEIIKKQEELPKDKEQKIIVYCSSGARSKKAQKKLEKIGYTQVYNLYNGFQNY